MAEWKRVILSGSNISQLYNDTGYLTEVYYNNLLGIPTGIVSASSYTSPSQGTLRVSINGINQPDVSLGLQTTDSPTFGSLQTTGNVSIGGDLYVNGTLSYIRTTNLQIEDKFVLINSGSIGSAEGGIVIDGGNGIGPSLFYEPAVGIDRWGFNQSVSQSSTVVSSTAYVSAVIDLNNANHQDTVEYQKPGNIKIDTVGDIWIYS